MVAVLKRSGLDDRDGPNGMTVPLATMPSYFPVPMIFSLVTLPSLVIEKYVSRCRRLGRSPRTHRSVFFPSREAFHPQAPERVLVEHATRRVAGVAPVIS